MKTFNYNFVIFVIICLAASGCTVDDSDRCSGDYIWDSHQAACIDPTDTGTSTATADDTTTGSSDTTSDLLNDTASDTEIKTGIGEPCSSDADCAKWPKYKKCLKDPTDLSKPGICTLENCQAADCPAGYKCCDCSASVFLKWPLPICIDNVNAQKLTTLCTCN
jgi:hypothetical protein